MTTPACYHGHMNDFEKRWQRISQLLSMEITGKERPMVSSGRTIFGIKSTAEQKMDEFAAQIEEEQAARRKARRLAGELNPENDPTKKAFCRSEIDRLAERALQKAIHDANEKLEERRQEQQKAQNEENKDR